LSNLPGKDGLVIEEKGHGEKSDEASRTGHGTSSVPGVPSVAEGPGATFALAGLLTPWEFLEVGKHTVEERDEGDMSRAWARAPMGEVAR
jgi:hypothetical protein